MARSISQKPSVLDSHSFPENSRSEVPDPPFCLALEAKVAERLGGAQGCLAKGNKCHIVPPNLLFSDINRGPDCLVLLAQHLSMCYIHPVNKK